MIFGKCIRTCKFRAKKHEWFYKKIKYFHVGTKGCYLEWFCDENGAWKWTYGWAYDWLKREIDHKSSAEQFWWGYKEAKRTENFKNFSIFFKYDLKKEQTNK